MPLTSLFLVAFAALVTAAIPGAAAAADDGPAKLCTIKNPRIDESSGLAASRRHPGIVYTFNDSGGRAQVYALGPDCRTRATLTLAGASNRDWEAMALGPDGIYVGDIGDNLDGAWPYVTVYRIPEPTVLRSQTLRATAYRIKYADGPRNAETMMIDPRSGRLYIASKAFGDSLYEGPKKLRTSGFNVMHKVGGAPFYATDGAFSPDGRTFVIRGYWDAEIYRAPGKKLTDVSIPNQKQGEGITFTADGRSLLVSSEGVRQPLWKVPVPASALPPKAKSAAPSEQSGKGHAGGSTSGSNKLSVTAMVAVAGVIVLIAALFARRRGS
ncbi:WD40 repeat domain-containing protein [Actinoallomurus bryophytorum]|uniref:WD40 repeat protein n=1 Tax=Actinoallomurus bryophytorum TaxID=1490222 RepID=A0A543CGI8_9ACTN|nr:hypothetical protein [Actinoallomurus bryophytorum]TQL96188.1 WD40 repeat protein [Actinoallomurus bryophytorum]